MSQKTMPAEYIAILENPLFQEMMDIMDDVVMVIDADTKILFVNKAYESTYGFKREQIIGKRLEKVEGDTAMIRVLKTGKTVNHEVEYLKSVNVDSVGKSAPITYNGETIGCFSVFNNVSNYIKLASNLRRTKEMDKYLKEQLANPEIIRHAQNFVTVNPYMKRMLGLAVKVAKSDATVMIRGESGTGKEIMAKVIHANSPRRKGPFIKVNCAAIPENLLESELFGYVGGAFTGARREGKPGKFEMANGGTIFLDEIGDMDFNMQVKLLRVIQEREVERIGGNKSIPLDVRIVTATNQNLEELIEKQKFRQDLYYRLNVIEIRILPLRKRKEDIPVLTHYFIKKLSGEDLAVTQGVVNILGMYDWPGNVRELQNVLEHACIMRDGEVIDELCLPHNLRPAETESRTTQVFTGSYNLREMTERLEKDLIIRVLQKCKTKSEAIEMLGISRSNFYEKLRDYELDPDQIRKDAQQNAAEQ